VDQSGFLPLGSVVALLLLVQNTLLGAVLALVWSLVILPHGARFLIRRTARDGDPFEDIETNYWRTGPHWRTGPR
jgi:hypothetical protein